MSDSAALAAESLAKAAVYVATLIAVGAGAAHWLARLAGPAASEVGAWIDHALRRRARRAVLLLLAALLVRAVAHTVTAFGAVGWADLRTIALESRWGHAWQLQLGATLLLTVEALVLHAERRWSWPLYSAGAVIVCGTIPLLGHAAGSSSRIALHALHIAAGGVWLGTLAVVVSLLPQAGRLDPALPARLISRFASFALPAAALVAMTGGVTALVYVGSPTHLWESTYGRRLLLKLAFVAAAAACGWLNWRRSRRGDPPQMRAMVIELGMALLVVIATGLLTETEHP